MVGVELEELLMKLFVHRGDVYAVQQGDGTYRTVYEPLTREVIRQHLQGEKTVGVYQIEPRTNTVKWLAFDLDGTDPPSVAEATKALYSQLLTRVPEKAVRLEKTRRGYHVWVFFAPPVPTPFAYSFGRGVAGETKLPTSTRIRDLHVEVFPKQSVVSEDGLGNLVKLPEGIHQVSKTRTRFVDENFRELDALRALSGVVPWSPPKELLESMKGVPVTPKEYEPILAEDFPCWRRISTGNIPVGARHATALMFACHLRDKGIVRGIATAIMREWWSRLPQSPPYPWEDAERCLRDAYEKGYWIGCKRIQSDFPELCDPSCPVRTKARGGRRISIAAFQEIEPTERIELLNGRYIFECHGTHSVLYDPLKGEMIAERGRYPGWDPWKWLSFRDEARRAFGKEVAEALGEIQRKQMAEWVKNEIQVVDDDYPASKIFFGSHSLKVNHSKSRGYIRISGSTYALRDELVKLGARWNVEAKAWELPYSEENLKRAIGFLRKHDKVKLQETDPEKLF
ncbi:MAG: hypothetical protein QW356_02010 [Candidatus Hadarchaeales archaeon]